MLGDVFTPKERQHLRDKLIDWARADPDVVGAALVGSATTGREDEWSDIDIAVQVKLGVDPGEVAGRWTARLYGELGAAHHLDVHASGALYRVFLLASSLQVDVSFWPEQQFRATGPGFQLLFGTPKPPSDSPSLNVTHEVGLAWLYALHGRSAIARGKTWQSTVMLDHLRDQLLVLACARHGLSSHHGRAADRLPVSFLNGLARARAASLDRDELVRSLDELLSELEREVEAHDSTLAARLRPVFAAMRLG